MPSLEDYHLLSRLSGVPLKTEVLREAFASYASPHNKIARLVRDGMLIPIRRGLYVVAPGGEMAQTSSFVISNHIYGPSYVSLQSALAHHGMIPEHVFEIQAMTSKRSRLFETAIGTFTYHNVPRAYYPIGITMMAQSLGNALIATPEKALADVVVYTQGIRIQSQKAMRTFLLSDMRIDQEALENLDCDLLRRIADAGYKRSALDLLWKVVSNGAANRV